MSERERIDETENELRMRAMATLFKTDQMLENNMHGTIFGEI